MGLVTHLLRLFFRRSLSPSKPPTPLERPRHYFHIPTIITSPDAPESLKVRSQTSHGKSYTVSLKHFACSCPDGAKRLKRYEYKHPLCACKHIRHLLDQGKLDIPAHFEALFESDFYNSFRSIHQASIHERPVLFAATASPWINVFAPTDFTEPGGYDMFGYSLTEQRWSYDHAPEFTQELLPILLALPPVPPEDATL